MTTVTLTEDIVSDYEVEGSTGRIFVQERTRLLDDAGSLVSETTHRRPIEPVEDVTAEPAEVKALATLVRTPERLARYERIVAGPVLEDAERLGIATDDLRTAMAGSDATAIRVAREDLAVLVDAETR